MEIEMVVQLVERIGFRNHFEPWTHPSTSLRDVILVIKGKVFSTDHQLYATIIGDIVVDQEKSLHLHQTGEGSEIYEGFFSNVEVHT